MSEQAFEKEAYVTPVKSEMTGLHATLINDNYVNKFEASVSVVETQYSQSRYEANLNAPQFGSTSQAYLPTQAFIGETYLIVTLAPVTSGDTSTFDLPTGWGLRLINNITYTMPSDTVGQITITNDEMFHYLYCQSRDFSSTSQLMALMGPSNIGKKVPVLQSDPDYPNWTATILLPLPWCSLGRDTKPLDATIFGSGQIFINITFAQPGSVYQLNTQGTGSGTLMIQSATLTFRQGELSNRAFSLKSLMLKNPSFIYDMPYIRSQYKSIGQIGVGSGINADNASVSTFISGLLNADLVGMCISAHYVPATNKVGNPYQAMKIYNLQVTFGGLTLYKSSGFSHALYNFQSALSAGYIVDDVNGKTADPIPPVGAGTPIANFPHIINFSRCRSMDWDDHYYNVQKWNAQTFNISFGVPNDFLSKYGSVNPLITPDVCEVRITCFYNAVFQLGQYRTQQKLL